MTSQLGHITSEFESPFVSYYRRYTEIALGSTNLSLDGDTESSVAGSPARRMTSKRYPFTLLARKRLLRRLHRYMIFPQGHVLFAKIGNKIGHLHFTQPVEIKILIIPFIDISHNNNKM